MHSNQLQLPEPSEQELERSRQLTALIKNEIEASGGTIDFSRFMELALYAPGLGYYSSVQQKFGESGDFITAPELSPWFAVCLGRQIASVLQQIPGADLLEAGAGTGVLAAGLLKHLEGVHALPEHYFILELSAELRQRQRQTLEAQVPQLVERVVWLNALPEIGFRGIVVANELLDAMPVQRFRVTSNGIKQLGVNWHNGVFHYQETDASNEIVTRIQPLALPVGITSEINFSAEAWIRSMAERLASGLILIIDYGYPGHEFYLPERRQGTLLCHYKHRAHDNPFLHVGLQDITSHIDFSAIAEAAFESGMSVMGYTSQAAFLMATGLSDIAAESNPENIQAHLTLTNQIKKLTLPSEMGEIFKVMALGKQLDQVLEGFSLQDRRGRL